VQQQRTRVLKQILIDLSKKTKWCVWRVYTENEKLRANIDVLDTLLELLGKRMKVADEIGVVKKAANVAVQNNRWTKFRENDFDGETKGLSEEFVLKLFKAIHQESISHQDKCNEA
jgi:chorismate mutase